MDTLTILPPGALREIVVLGTSELVPDVVRHCAGHAVRVVVFLAPRQADVADRLGQPVARSAREAGADVHVVDDLRAAAEGPYSRDPAGGVILSFGSPWIIPLALIDRYEGRVINSHGAPLPHWRGGGGFSWRMMAGDRRGATLYHLVTPGIDDGDILLYRPYDFPEALRTPDDWQAYAIDQDRSHVRELLDGLVAGRSFALARQDEADATYFPRLHTPTHGWIDWSWDSEEICAFIQAFGPPYPGASTRLNGEEVRLMAAFAEASPHPLHPFMAGLVLRQQAGDAVVAARGGLVRIPAGAFHGPQAPKEGDRFWTPSDILDRARETRVRFTPQGARL